jgi:predicted nucleic acid-binding protein
MELVGEGRFEIGITAALVLEYESVCKRLEGIDWVTAEDVDTLVDYLCRVGKQLVVHFRTRPSVPDPDDELVLEAALASGSDWIVTHNVRDLAAAAARFGIEAITPAEALRRLGEGK